jgi:hypothetical protein
LPHRCAFGMIGVLRLRKSARFACGLTALRMTILWGTWEVYELPCVPDAGEAPSGSAPLNTALEPMWAGIIESNCSLR